MEGYSRGLDQMERFARRSQFVKCTVDGLDPWCWVLKPNQPSGYAVTTLSLDDGSRKTFLVHRLAYMVLVADIPPGLELDHRCGVLTCWNPGHLDPVTRSVNQRRSNAGRKPNDHYCQNGHRRTEENTYKYVTRSGRRARTCRECAQVRYQKRRARKDFLK